VTGTLAIDYLGTYPGAFAELPRHAGINLSIQLGGIERHFGGCAMNIAYGLKLLGEEPTPYVYVGGDFDRSYADHLVAARIDLSGIQVVEEAYSAHAFIFTDREQNQFTGFFGGPPADNDFEAKLAEFARGYEYAILAPDIPSHMIPAARAMHAAGVPFLTDPGQNLTDFHGPGALELLRLSEGLIVNEFEYQRLVELVGSALEDVDLVIVTEGSRGTRWRSRTMGEGRERAVPAEVADPTGCGDAFRGGFVHARLNGADLRDAVRAGGVMAAIALEAVGTQSHRGDTFAKRYRSAWGSLPDWLPSPSTGRTP